MPSAAFLLAQYKTDLKDFLSNKISQPLTRYKYRENIPYYSAPCQLQRPEKYAINLLTRAFIYVILIIQLSIRSTVWRYIDGHF